ncbi:hypothetical protein CHELA40_10454 [Chelatococcus asaccharovorans]|nr:hypothetical protein CHELA40_10454 [Chelatococcus asaccharovorans]CAH1686675.1 hypothetical protein CHELA17_65152 [Chelatococcus asaccharovorans]
MSGNPEGRVRAGTSPLNFGSPDGLEVFVSMHCHHATGAHFARPSPWTDRHGYEARGLRTDKYFHYSNLT